MRWAQIEGRGSLIVRPFEKKYQRDLGVPLIEPLMFKPAKISASALILFFSGPYITIRSTKVLFCVVQLYYGNLAREDVEASTGHQKTQFFGRRGQNDPRISGKPDHNILWCVRKTCYVRDRRSGHSVSAVDEVGHVKDLTEYEIR